MRSIALVISVVFQPLLMPALVYGMILFAVPEATIIPEEFKERIFFSNYSLHFADSDGYNYRSETEWDSQKSTHAGGE
ncbi:hypothetical protein [Algoriphagus boritolerans]|uniref:hypothetical protein n=1 Tax=Algoriphagus boritolerans TaxID=308111 RepID=UPI000A435DD4